MNHYVDKISRWKLNKLLLRLYNYDYEMLYALVTDGNLNIHLVK